MWILSLSACYHYDVRHFDVLDRPDPIVALASTAPLPAEYVLGEPVSASDCETGASEVDIQALIDRARGDHDAIVQFTVQRRIRGTCVGYGTYRALDQWQPSPFECLREDSRGIRLRNDAAWLAGLRAVALGDQQVCYVVSGRVADVDAPTATAPAPTAAASTVPAPSPSAPVPPAPAPPSIGPSAVVTLAPGAPPFTAIEVQCPGGFRQRADFVSGVAHVSGVPEEDCEVFFKGGPPSKARLSGAAQVTCTFHGVAASCR